MAKSCALHCVRGTRTSFPYKQCRYRRSLDVCYKCGPTSPRAVASLSITDHTGTIKTAFVLAGGGSFGAIQVGMMHSLAAHGIFPDMVVGSSVGAINGAYYAGDPTLKG